MSLPFSRVDDFGGKKERMHFSFVCLVSPAALFVSSSASFVLLLLFRPQLRFDKMKGVARCVVGYSGGKTKDPTYRNMRDHTEAFLVEFDPSVVSYEDLVISWTQIHIPIRCKGKCQYRSAVWYMDEEQQEVVEEVVKAWRVSVREPLYTDVEAALTFYRAEEYHQFFLKKSRD
jgi:peptide-methionine (S)-S-oxide reductase